MKHFSSEEWIDFANKVVSGSKRADMQKHLQTGCKRCAKAAALWQKVRRSAENEANYQPPADALHMVEAAFAAKHAASGRREARGIIELLFDSFLQPAVAGARSARSAARQLLYRADPYHVDLHIEAKPGTSHVVVTGQLLDTNQPEHIARNVEILLSSGAEKVARISTNEFGEFRGEIENKGELKLSFAGPGEKRIVLTMQDALDPAPGHPRSGAWR